MAKIKAVPGVGDAIGKDQFYFYCPGCKCCHAFGHTWNFNGDLERPTFTPSLLVFYTHPETKQRVSICHSFVTDGRIQFLGDCEHTLAGQTVDIPDWKD
jgi:hypothetical protein